MPEISYILSFGMSEFKYQNIWDILLHFSYRNNFNSIKLLSINKMKIPLWDAGNQYF